MSSQSKQKKVKGNRQKLKLFRLKDPIKSILMWGISYSMSQLAHVTRRAFLMDEDFRASIKVGVDNYQFSKDYLPSHFKFKEYAPMVFLDLRTRFGVDDRDYLTSFTAYSPTRLKKSPKKYSSMLLSHNKKFSVKIVNSEDVSLIQGFLADYHEHVVQALGKTLLSQILAMYRLTVADQHTYMVVMRNMHYPPGDVTRLYLLEGSTDKPLEKERAPKTAGGGVDTNPDEPQWAAFGDGSLLGDNVRICLSEESRTDLLQVLCGDMQFLEASKMKFKVLLGLLDPESQRFQAAEDTGLQRPLWSEEEADEEVAQAAGADDRRPSIECGAADLSDHDLEGEEDGRAVLASTEGTRVGPYGFRDNLDPSIVYFVGLVSFFKKRHLHKPKERKQSLAQAQVARPEHAAVARLDSSQAEVHADPGSGGGSGRLLSSRLLGTLTQIIE